MPSRAEQARRKLAAALTRLVDSIREGAIPNRGSYTAPALLTMVGLDPDAYKVGAVKWELEKAGLTSDANHRFRASVLHRKADDIERHARLLTAQRQPSIVELRRLREEGADAE